MNEHSDADQSDPEPLDTPVLLVSFDSTAKSVQLGEAIPVTMHLHNKGEVSLPYLPINTAFEQSVQADVFEVLHNGEPAPYLGIVARRLPVTLEDVVVLEADEKLEKIVNIEQLYKMDVPGEYEIRYVPRQLVVGPELDVTFEKVVVGTDVLVISVE